MRCGARGCAFRSTVLTPWKSTQLSRPAPNWCGSAGRELALGRSLVYHSWTQGVLPKHVEPGLVLLRDPKVRVHGDESLAELAARVTDRNFRLFAERGQLHVINGAMRLQ